MPRKPQSICCQGSAAPISLRAMLTIGDYQPPQSGSAIGQIMGCLYPVNCFDVWLRQHDLQPYFAFFGKPLPMGDHALAALLVFMPGPGHGWLIPFHKAPIWRSHAAGSGQTAGKFMPAPA